MRKEFKIKVPLKQNTDTQKEASQNYRRSEGGRRSGLGYQVSKETLGCWRSAQVVRRQTMTCLDTDKFLKVGCGKK